MKIPAKNVKSDITCMHVERELEGNNPLFPWWLTLDGRIQVSQDWITQHNQEQGVLNMVESEVRGAEGYAV